MSTHDDDFWGSTGDWTSTTPRRTPRTAADHTSDVTRTRPIDIIRRGWAQMLTGGANATREHGIARPDAARTTSGSADVFGDDDFDLVAASTDWARPPVAPPPAPTRGADLPLIVPAEEPSHEVTRELVRSLAEARRDAGHGEPSGHGFYDHEAHGDDLFDDHFGGAGFDDGGFDDDNDDDPIASWDDEFVPVQQRAGLDPLLTRIGALAVVTALAVPLLLSFGSDGGDTLFEEATAAPAATVAAVPVTEPAPSTAAPEAAGDQPAADVVETTAAAPATTATAASAEPAATSATQPPTTQSAAGEPATAAALEASSDDATDDASLGTAQSVADEPAAADSPAERVERICAIDYEVVAGDFWIRLADGAGVPLAELLEANGASASTPLFPGQTICLPAGSSIPPPPTTAPPTTVPPTTTPPTTAPPTTVPPTTAPPTTVPSTPGSVQQIIRDVWPDELEDKALEIAWRESRYDPYAQNFCCYGIFQIYWEVHRGWLDEIGVTSSQQLFDPETNARAAYALYQRAGGWGPWQL